MTEPSDDDLAMQAIGIPHKGVVLGARYATIDHPQTRSPNPVKSGPSMNGAQVLRVRFHDGAEEYTHDLPNGGFDIENPSLQFLAACGASPSRTEDVRGTFVPVVPADEGPQAKGLAAPLMEHGREKLAELPWGPDPPEDEGEAEEQA